jgi:hypothetical protein
VIASGAIELYEVTLPEIIDPRRVEGGIPTSVPGVFQESARAILDMAETASSIYLATQRYWRAKER